MSTEEFDTILNDCLQLLLEGNKNLEECLSLYPEQADKLRELLILAQAINTLQVETDDNARFRIKQRFLAAASSRRHRSRPVIRSGFFRTLFTSSAAALLVLVVIFIGNSASTEALPGDFLYPVKKAGEQVDETLARDVESKASVGIKLTERRNQELIKLENQPGRVTPAFLISIADQTQKTIDLVSQSGEKAEFTERLSDLTSQQEQSLTKLSGNVSPEVQKGIEKAIEIARGGKDTRERDDDRREPNERDRDDDHERDRDDDDERDRDDDDDEAGGQVIPPTTQPGTPTRERSDDRKDDREEEGERTGRTPVSGRGPERPQPDRREQEDNKKPTPEPRKTPESANPRREDEAKKPQPEQKRDNENARPDSGPRRENDNDKNPSARPEERRNDSRQPEREERRNNEDEQRDRGGRSGEDRTRSDNERQDNEKARSGNERQDKETNSRGKSEGR